jgi:probable rRNA maturation factor
VALELSLSREAALGRLPSQDDFQAWAEAALHDQPGLFTLSLRLVGATESRKLNHRYRGKNRPTNVLSFSAGVPPELAGGLGFTPLGDLALCAPVVVREAKEQGKLPAHHWAHLTIHGVLHLLGFDHEEPVQAALMEQREREILAGLGIADPYREPAAR